MTGNEPIGKRVKRLRLEQGLSQRDVASPGVSYAYISRIEAGARSPSVKALRKLAPKLGVSVEYLENGEPGPVEAACNDAELDYASLTVGELGRLEVVAEEAAYRSALTLALDIRRDRAKEEAKRLREAAKELERRMP